MLSKQDSTPISVSQVCANCRVKGLCIPGALSGFEVEEFEQIVVHHPPLRQGEYVFSQGAPSHSIYAVRSGSLKNVRVSKRDMRQVQSFSMCGDMLGLEAIETSHYRVSAIALETTCVCSIPFDLLNMLASNIPALQQQLFRILSRQLEAENLTVLNFAAGNAQQKLTALLLKLSERHGICHYSTDEFTLHMSRRDIASYLGIAYETLARLLARFQKDGLIGIRNRNRLQILQPQALISMLEVIPRNFMFTSG